MYSDLLIKGSYNKIDWQQMSVLLKIEVGSLQLELCFNFQASTNNYHTVKVHIRMWPRGDIPWSERWMCY